MLILHLDLLGLSPGHSLIQFLKVPSGDMFGQSTPIPNAMVAITIRSVPSHLANSVIMWYLTAVCVHRVNMSTTLNCGRLGAIGSLIWF